MGVGDSSLVKIVLRENRAGTQRYAVELELAQRRRGDDDVLALCSTVVLIGIRQMSVCIRPSPFSRAAVDAAFAADSGCPSLIERASTVGGQIAFAFKDRCVVERRDGDADRLFGAGGTMVVFGLNLELAFDGFRAIMTIVQQTCI